MNFMAIIRGLEQFVYEVVTWFVFFPRLLFQQLTSPIRMMNYAYGEFGKPEDDRFDAALSPLLFLLLSILISHLIEIAVRIRAPDAIPVISLGILKSDLNLVLFRAVVFAAFPLTFAIQETWTRRVPLARSTLQPLFYVQCLPAAVYALTVNAGMFFSHLVEHPAAVSGGIFVGASIWYLIVQFLWQREQGQSAFRAIGAALSGFLAGWAAVYFSALLLAAVEAG